MQLDDNVGRIAPQVPTIVNKSFELFASELMSKAAALAAKNGEKKLLASHLEQSVASDPLYDFLRGITATAAAPKRSRAPSGGSSKRQAISSGAGSSLGAAPASGSGGGSAGAAAGGGDGARFVFEGNYRPLPEDGEDYD
ncbi:DNA polymerase epsilon subunit c [Chrysochromulina tobinii]|uniref:DNA polymerase epsilon subunit c n=1 Tax=Chrysochromulina tobinii TaxID=1460289 RepID=A0A0M0JS55_9EUKA|nr:DNA polymerase epsilon subunit c [Chrysochromulina tobinii]|eukprot:KOO29033.1 DNA polymerase epsilon subunit c [Chrysochromulina sp. CCMP291]